MNEVLINQIFKSIFYERKEQIEKWGDQTHDLPIWISILTEEVGEAAQEANDYHFEAPFKKTTMDEEFIFKNGDHSFIHFQRHRLIRLRSELIQVAAVAVSIIEDLELKINKHDEDIHSR